MRPLAPLRSNEEQISSLTLNRGPTRPENSDDWPRLRFVQYRAQPRRHFANMRLFDDVEVVAGNLVCLNPAAHELAPSFDQVIISRHIARQKQRDVAGVNLRLVIFHRGEIDLFDVLQNWR